MKTASQIIEKIKSERTTFMGMDVRKYNYAIDIREKLQEMAESGELSPRKYWSALRNTWGDMSKTEKSAELNA